MTDGEIAFRPDFLAEGGLNFAPMLLFGVNLRFILDDTHHTHFDTDTFWGDDSVVANLRKLVSLDLDMGGDAASKQVKVLLAHGSLAAFPSAEIALWESQVISSLKLGEIALKDSSKFDPPLGNVFPKMPDAIALNIGVRPITLSADWGPAQAFELVQGLACLKEPEGLAVEPLRLNQALLLELQRDLLTDGDRPFLTQFLKIRFTSVIAAHLCQFVHSPEANLEEWFKSLVDLIDPYDRNPHFLRLFLTELKSKVDASPPSGALLQFLEEFVKWTPNSGSEHLREVFRHRTFSKGNQMLNMITPPVCGLAHTVWSSFAFGTSPIFRLFLQFLPFFRKFAFMPALSGLIWTLRSRFADSPAVLGAVLRCSSLFPSDDLLQLQKFAFAARWQSIDVRPSLRRGSNAYSQIHSLVEEFVRDYAVFIDSLVTVVNNHRQSATTADPRLLASIVAPASEIHPHSIIQFTHKERILTGAVVHMLDKLLVEDTLSQVFEIPCPICKFEMPADGKDLFGFTTDQWRTAFSFAPNLNKPLSALTAADFNTETVDQPENHDVKYGFLGPILAIYSPKDQPELFCESLSTNLRYRLPRDGRGKRQFEFVAFPKALLSQGVLSLLPQVLQNALRESATGK
jgi:hypothetical protein